MRRFALAFAVLAACGSPERESTRVRAVVERYLRAIRTADWSGACETFTEPSQAALARYGGSCRDAMASMFSRPGVRAAIATMRIGQVTVSGDRATVAMDMPGEPGDDDPMRLVKVAAGWRIDERADEPAPAPTPAAPAFMATSTDEKEIAALVGRYLRGIGDGAWQAICDTRVELEQNQLAQLAGSCASAMQKAFDRIGARIAATMEVKRIEVTGETAMIWIGQPNQDALDDALRATRVAAGWRLYDPPPTE